MIKTGAELIEKMQVLRPASAMDAPLEVIGEIYADGENQGEQRFILARVRRVEYKRGVLSIVIDEK